MFTRWSPDANSSSAALKFPTRKVLTVIRMPTPSCTRFATPSLGSFFPNTDPRWRGAPSSVFLQEAARQVALRKGKIVNVDATVVAQQPKLNPHIAEMKKRIASALGITEQQVGVKATTNEKLGFLGREEGIAAMAVAGVDW
jgi:2-C-methyl-D-erythritol 2,4-cyclodiphosphate synthase